MNTLSNKNLKNGFTLIEVVISIVIMSIISIGLTSFILDSAEGYVQTSARNQISSSGRNVINRLSMEVHSALPNSIRISSAYTAGSPQVIDGDAYAGDQCLEFVPVIAASTYINPPFSSASATFDTVEFVPDQDGSSGLFSFIYPLNTSDVYQNPTPSRSPRAEVLSVTHDALTDIDHIILTANHRFKRQSRVQRIFLTEQPISFCTKGNKLYRYSNYDFQSTQLRPINIDSSCAATACLPAATPNRVLISDAINNASFTAFDQLSASRRRNSVIQFELNFTQRDESILLNHETLLQASP